MNTTNAKSYLLYFCILISTLLYSCNSDFGKDYDGFFSACRNGDLDKVKEYVEKGYDINHEMCENINLKAYICETPLRIAVNNEDYELYEYVVLNGADPGDTVSLIISKYNSLKTSVDRINSKKYPVKENNVKPNTMEITLLNRYKFNQILPYESNNFNPNIIDKEGKHLVEYVIESKKYKILPELFYKGANPNHKVDDNHTIKDLLVEKLSIYEKMIDINNKLEEPQ